MLNYMSDCLVMIFDIFFMRVSRISSTMVTGTPCHNSLPYAHRSMVYSHFVTIDRIMTLKCSN